MVIRMVARDHRERSLDLREDQRLPLEKSGGVSCEGRSVGEGCAERRTPVCSVPTLVRSVRSRRHCLSLALWAEREQWWNGHLRLPLCL